jgi:plasmid stabilization system protein ParE
VTVEWHDKALDALADIWVAIGAAERDLYEQTVRDINARLAVGPAELGESRANDRDRVWFNYPLVVWFRLYTGGRVKVFHVARLRPRASGSDSD